MANQDYVSALTEEQIEGALTAIYSVIQARNNNKVLAISGGKIVARSVQWGGGGGTTIIVKPDTATANGTYYAATDSADGYSEFTVAVPTQTLPSAVGVLF